MSPLRLTLKNITGHGLRSLLAFLCILGISAFFISTMVVSQGAQQSLQKGLERLGADIIIIPEGAQTDIETALLMGKPSNLWMAKSNLDKVTAIDGVAAVSPQIYLQSLYQASCCSVSETFLVVYDPKTDFTITPWLHEKLGRDLATGEVIGGANIFSPDNDGTIKLYGTTLKLIANLEPTGTGMDQTIFFNGDTAQQLARLSLTRAVSPLKIPPDEISSILVKLKPGTDVHTVIAPIFLNIPGVVPMPSPQLFGTFRDQILGLLGGITVFLSLGWILSAVLIWLVFSLAINERQRELAVLRALGATRRYILQLLLGEVALLAAGAATAGAIIGILGIFIFQSYCAGTLKIPFLFPSAASLVGLYLLNLIIALVIVSLATIYPSVKISRMEPALGMKE